MTLIDEYERTLMINVIMSTFQLSTSSLQQYIPYVLSYDANVSQLKRAGYTIWILLTRFFYAPMCQQVEKEELLKSRLHNKFYSYQHHFLDRYDVSVCQYFRS